MMRRGFVLRSLCPSRLGEMAPASLPSASAESVSILQQVVPSAVAALGLATLFHAAHKRRQKSLVHASRSKVRRRHKSVIDQGARHKRRKRKSVHPVSLSASGDAAAHFGRWSAPVHSESMASDSRMVTGPFHLSFFTTDDDLQHSEQSALLPSTRKAARERDPARTAHMAPKEQALAQAVDADMWVTRPRFSAQAGTPSEGMPESLRKTRAQELLLRSVELKEKQELVEAAIQELFQSREVLDRNPLLQAHAPENRYELRSKLDKLLMRAEQLKSEEKTTARKLDDVLSQEPQSAPRPQAGRQGHLVAYLQDVLKHYKHAERNHQPLNTSSDRLREAFSISRDTEMDPQEVLQQEAVASFLIHHYFKGLVRYSRIMQPPGRSRSPRQKQQDLALWVHTRSMTSVQEAVEQKDDVLAGAPPAWKVKHTIYNVGVDTCFLLALVVTYETQEGSGNVRASRLQGFDWLGSVTIERDPDGLRQRFQPIGYILRIGHQQWHGYRTTGHYVAIVRCPNTKWYFCNDSEVSLQSDAAVSHLLAANTVTAIFYANASNFEQNLRSEVHAPVGIVNGGGMDCFIAAIVQNLANIFRYRAPSP